MAFSVALNETASTNLQTVKENLANLSQVKVSVDFSEALSNRNEIEKIINGLTYDELNILLFRYASFVKFKCIEFSSMPKC